MGLVFDKTGRLDGCAVGFVDFDYASDHDKRKSLTSYVFTLASNVVTSELESNITCYSFFVYY